jgi:tetratricopeptide (TPR) repeat protein
MSLREATALVESFESKQVPASRKPPAPTTMEESLAVLKSDRLDLFPGSVAFLSSQTTPEATALKAQTLLAWGEAELTVAEVLATTADRLDQNVRALQVRKLSEADSAKLDAERARVQLYRDTDQALRLLAAEHVAAGVEDAQKIIDAKPDDYVGYRISADAHRLRNEWKEFSDDVAKVEEKNPDSNGLIFLRGVAAQMRDGDANEAIKLYRQALENDPQFVRAQAQLVLVQTNVFEQKKELEKLKAIAPDHQIVRWAGPGIEQAFEEAQERQAAIQNALGGRAGQSPTVPPTK